jgi:hypothetical protein
VGRKRIYNTEDEKLEAQRRWNMEYYQRNRDVIKKKAVDRYRKKKIRLVSRDLYGEDQNSG